jgi:glucosamine--fructose-6-phosphate aminotransferase (isomerizing)
MTQHYICYGEIVDQAGAWQEAVDAVLAKRAAIQGFFAETQPAEIIFAGCTSPYYAGIAASVYWQSATGIHSRAVPCSELVQFPKGFYSSRDGKPVMVVLSRSGKTTETLWAVEEFEKQFPGRTLLIGCRPDSPLAEMVPLNVMLPKGFEASIPQTRSFSVMYLAALMAGAIVSGQDEVLETLKNAPQIVDGIVQSTEGTIIDATNVKDFKNIFLLGSGPLYGIAREATLKMMEMTISDAICVPFLESRHGPRSLIDEGSLVIGFYSHAGRGVEAAVMDELTRNHGASTVAVVPTSDWESGACSYKVAAGCDWPDGIQGLAYLPILQLLAYYRAVAKGVNPDTSRNLTSYIEIARA